MNSEEEFIAEYESSFKPQTFLPGGRPRSSLDYIKFQSEDYLKYSLKEKVKAWLKPLNLEEKYVNEVLEICFSYRKKFEKEGNSLRIVDVIPIIAYKVIRKHELPITHLEIKQRLNVDVSRLLKLTNKLIVYNQFAGQEVEENFLLSVYDYLNHLIKRLVQFHKSNPDAIKRKQGDEFLELYADKFYSLTEIADFHDIKIKPSACAFEDVTALIERIRLEAKDLIFCKASDRENSFCSVFRGKVLKEVLAASLIKILLERKGFKINLSTFRNVFQIAGSSISKATRSIQNFVCGKLKKL